MNPKFATDKEETLRAFCDFAEYSMVRAPAWPLELFLEISNLCDLKCAMCGTFSGLNKKRFIHLKQIERGFLDVPMESVDSLLQHALLIHFFGYGEPTLNPNFKKILQQATVYETA
ncbi:MAG: hypothetical protein AAF512_12700, partial [Pseudomonadota bacterium]